MVRKSQQVSRPRYGEEGAHRSGGRCTVKRAPTGQEGAKCEEGAERSGGRCMVGRAPTDQEGAVW